MEAAIFEGGAEAGARHIGLRTDKAVDPLLHPGTTSKVDGKD